MSATALRRASTVDQLTAVLRERILAGDLAPGQRLIERELVEAYEVARHTLRAALRRSRSRASCASSPTAARAWRCCRATS